MSANDFSILKIVPAVLRARGYRLYTQGGKRIIDLWLNGGAAILGHTPPNMLRELKNTASRGLYAPFPHFTENRFLKALSKLFPEYNLWLYAAPPPELSALINSGAAKLWRPFSEPASPFAVDEKIQIPVLPGIQLWRHDLQTGMELPMGLCIVAAKSKNDLSQLPQGDILPPILLAMAARGLYDLLASPERAKPVLPQTFKALHSNKLWQRKGIYLTLKEKTNNEEWTALFRQFLEAGFLLPPVPSQPVILPGELSLGEDAKLASVLNT